MTVAGGAAGIVKAALIRDSNYCYFRGCGPTGANNHGRPSHQTFAAPQVTSRETQIRPPQVSETALFVRVDGVP
jgi:hypothetical protein